MKLKTVLGLIAMIGFAGLLLFNFGSQVGGYMNFAEAAERGSKAHVVGTWVEERPSNYDRSANVFTFYMRDQSGTVRKVRYPNPKPANFEKAEKVVVEGKMQGEAFKAESILVKCPSKYNNAKNLKQTRQTSSSSAPTTETARQ